MMPPSKTRNPSHLSVSRKISLGFTIVLLLHVSIAVLGHYGLSNADRNMDTYDRMRKEALAIATIDREVGELQRNVLLFTYTGHDGPEQRARELHDDLRDLLEDAEKSYSSETDTATLDKMRAHLDSHREIFEAVVLDRDRRRKLYDEDMSTLIADIAQQLNEIERSQPSLISAVLSARSSIQVAQLEALHFMRGPDSAHVRKAKQDLAAATTALDRMLDHTAMSGARQAVDSVHGLVSRYEEAFIQMVQATRGYLHLVNVVMPGEAAEFRRLASAFRTHKVSEVNGLAATMAADSRRFQAISNVFSIITIVLGILAAWLIARDVAPPLIAIAATFDRLTQGSHEDHIPGIHRRDELGRLAAAAQLFKEGANDTQRLLEATKTAQADLQAHAEALEKAKLEAESSTQAKSSFLANMSHEIRTPMAAILGFAEVLAEKHTEDERDSAIATIRRNGEHLLQIINDILDLSKIEAGKMSVENIAFSPTEVIGEVAALMRSRAESRGLTLTVDCRHSKDVDVTGDPMRLKQILVNLVGNAIKFTEHGGVRVRAEVEQVGNRNVLQIDVRDTGIGLSREQIANLFQPFAQADSSTTRRYGGTGLGLTISQRFAALLDGTITVSSTPGEGSCFRVRVDGGPAHDTWQPKAPARRQHAAVDDITGSDSLAGVRVLLAEDGLDNQKLLTHILKKAGATFTVVDNGAAAVEEALAARDAGSPFDVVLMDMQMPVLDGYAATAQLRESGYDGAIFALTAHAMAGDRDQCLNAGCDEYATKPINRQALLAMIRNHAHGSART